MLIVALQILIKGLSNRLGIPWSLAKEWAPTARQVLANKYQPIADTAVEGQRVRFKDVWRTLKLWSKGRATTVMRRLPAPLRTRVAALVLRVQERQTRRKLMKREA